MFVGGFLLRGTPTYPNSSVFHDGFNPPNFPFSFLLHEIHGNVMVIAVSLLQMRCIVPTKSALGLHPVWTVYKKMYCLHKEPGCLSKCTKAC